MNMEEPLDLAFAKIYSDLNGRDFIAVSGLIVPLAVDDVQVNNKVVGEIVRALRTGSRGKMTLASSAVGALVGGDSDATAVVA